MNAGNETKSTIAELRTILEGAVHAWWDLRTVEGMMTSDPQLCDALFGIEVMAREKFDEAVARCRAELERNHDITTACVWVLPALRGIVRTVDLWAELTEMLGDSCECCCSDPNPKTEAMDIAIDAASNVLGLQARYSELFARTALPAGSSHASRP